MFSVCSHQGDAYMIADMSLTAEDAALIAKSAGIVRRIALACARAASAPDEDAAVIAARVHTILQVACYVHAHACGISSWEALIPTEQILWDSVVAAGAPTAPVTSSGGVA